MTQVKLVYYVDVLSSWCLVADDALAKVLEEFGPQIDYEWRIAALRESLNYTTDQLSWYYRRTKSVTGVELNPVWLQSTADGSRFANLVAEAARSLGCVDDRVRLALARSTMIEGKRTSQRDIAVDVAAVAGRLDRASLDRAVDDPKVADRIRATSAQFAELKVDVRPTFVLRNAIGDTSVLSGCWRYDVLRTCIRALLDDQSGYQEFATSNPPPAGAV